MNDRDRVRLLHGPYTPPRLRRGDHDLAVLDARERCEC